MLGWPLDSDQYRFFVNQTTGSVSKYAIILDEKGKHYPITFMVGLNEKAQVTKVEILVYREQIGSEVRKSRFLSQFRGKTSNDPIQVNQDIRHISGATVSSWSVTAGVRKAVILTNYFFNKTGGDSEKTS